MKKILITGASGFIGKNLLDYFLKKKFSIFIILRKSKKNINFCKEKNKNKNLKSILFTSSDNLYAQLDLKDQSYLPHPVPPGRARHQG